MPLPPIPSDDLLARQPLLNSACLRERFAAPDAALLAAMARAYGDDPSLVRERAAAAVVVLDRFLATHGDRPAALYRAPARISLNPHCDHQGAWVPYGLHRRELLAVIAPASDGQVRISNVDASFVECLTFEAAEEIARDEDAWAHGWLPYLESPAVAASVAANRDVKGQSAGRRATLSYVRAAYLRFRREAGDRPLPGLRMTLSGNIAQGAGQSSSSAIVVLTALALRDFQGLPIERRALAEKCGEAEWYVGTRGGSGDHAAILLGQRDALTHLRFRAPVGIREVRYSPFPPGMELILANSQTRSEKSAEERLLFNRGIFAYRFAFLALKEAMAEAGYPAAMIEETESLGDLHAGRIPTAELYNLVLRLPENASPGDLAARFPATFGPAARGCFGTDDPDCLPAQIPLRGAAVYGLGRVDRGWAMPSLLETADEPALIEFGRLMSVTHDGDRLHAHGLDWDVAEYTEGRERVSDAWLERAARASRAGDEQSLRHEPGFYGASILVLDRLVDAALRTEGVLGAGLMGAGGGGYVLILARRGAFERVRGALVRDYYEPLAKEPDVEPWHPTSAACRLL